MSFEELFADGLPSLEAGSGLRLRAFDERDAPQVFRLYGDREAVRFGYQPRMESLDDALQVVADCRQMAAARTLFHWGVALAETDEVIGHGTLLRLDRAHRRTEIGYSVRRDCWGRGLGTRIAAILIDLAFDRLDLLRVEADVDPRNLASLRLLEKLGFQREGLLRERWVLGGEVQDAVMLGLLRREWRGWPR